MNQLIRTFKNHHEYSALCDNLQHTAVRLAELKWQDRSLSGWIFTVGLLPCRFTQFKANLKFRYYCPDTKQSDHLELAPPGNWIREDSDPLTNHFSVKGCHRLTLEDTVLCIRKDGVYRHKVGQCDGKRFWEPEDYHQEKLI